MSSIHVFPIGLDPSANPEYLIPEQNSLLLFPMSPLPLAQEARRYVKIKPFMISAFARLSFACYVGSLRENHTQFPVPSAW